MIRIFFPDYKMSGVRKTQKNIASSKIRGKGVPAKSPMRGMNRNNNGVQFNMNNNKASMQFRNNGQNNNFNWQMPIPYDRNDCGCDGVSQKINPCLCMTGGSCSRG